MRNETAYINTPNTLSLEYSLDDGAAAAATTAAAIHYAQLLLSEESCSNFGLCASIYMGFFLFS